MGNELQVFFVKFFGSLKCKINSEINSLIISDIPQKFEKFSGKKGPYYFAFNEEKEGYELITANHYLIKTIKDFLEGSGETTLLKLSPRINLQEELPKIIPFRDSKIRSITKQEKINFIFKFSFSTIFQYLNERENVLNNIYVYNNDLIEFDETLQLEEGNKKDIGEINLEREYDFAKEKLKGIIQPKVNELGTKLNSLMKEEISRIKEHYKVDLSELREQEEGLKKQIELNKEDFEKVKKFERSLQNLRDEKNIDKIQNEEQNFIDQEIKKHSLSVNTRLINTAVIYFPTYIMNLILELPNKNQKIIEMTYDPLNKKISPMFCQSCKKELDEIIVCSSGHLTCRKCGNRCVYCDGITCKNCTEHKCYDCGKKICAKCSAICSKCRKTFCARHIHQIDSSKKFCKSCVQKCSECGVIVDPELAIKNSGKIICLKCSGKKIRSEINRN